MNEEAEYYHDALSDSELLSKIIRFILKQLFCYSLCVNDPCVYVCV